MRHAMSALFAVLLAGASSAAPAAPALPKATACPYTPAEVTAALGVSVKAGQPDEMPFPGGVEYSCSYGQTDGFLTLWVSQTVMSLADQQKGDAYYQQSLAGNTNAIAGDPDRARWQLDAYDPKNVALHYTRGTHRVAVRVTGGPFKADALQPKLLRLRRLP